MNCIKIEIMISSRLSSGSARSLIVKQGLPFLKGNNNSLYVLQ